MIIDMHGHVSAPAEMYAFKALLLAARSDVGATPRISDEQLEAGMQRHLRVLAQVGTDLQFISVRPFQQMHSEQPERIVRTWIRFQNDIIARQCRLHPEVFRGIAAMPQSPFTSPKTWVDELERCVKDLGFIGTLINPDPGEGVHQVPPMGDEYWYPVYEKLTELDIPALIHSAGCRNGRESFSNHFITEETIAVLSLIDSDVFSDFPNLKIIVGHGGGSVPYQIGRWRSARWRGGEMVRSFDEDLRRMYFDSVLYNRESIDLLIRTVGSDRVMFGTENPGAGGGVDPVTGRSLDDLKPVINDIASLTEEDRQRIFEKNVRTVFTRLRIPEGSSMGTQAP